MGLVSFWLCSEDTYGSVYSYDYGEVPFKGNERNAYFAMKSREHVLNHEKYPIFAKYASAIGIDEPQTLPEWNAITEKLNKIEEDKIKAAQEKKRKEEEAKRIEEERILAEEAAKKAAEEQARLDALEAIRVEEERKRNELNHPEKLFNQYFQFLKQKDLTKFIGTKVAIKI